MFSQSSICSSQEDYQCIFCAPEESLETSNSLFLMMNQALISKHSSTQSNTIITLPIDILTKEQQPCGHNENLLLCKYKEYHFIDQHEQNLKRQYKIGEYQKKIQMLSEYYKFHKDIPKVVQKEVERILGKYYDRKREHDYKYLKRKLKQEQNLSITSIQSQNTENSQSIQKKSRYSTLLDALQQSQHVFKQKNDPKLSDSNILQQICQQIGNALPKTKVNEEEFMGYFINNQKKFENYVKKAQRNKKNRPQKGTRFQWPSNTESFKKKNKQQDQQINYFRLQRKLKNKDNQKTLKNRMKGDTQRFQKRLNKQQRSYKNDHDRSYEKRKFVYNTNVKIQIKNALFQLKSPQQRYGTIQKSNKSRKSLVGKVIALNDDRYRTPVSKIYQPQQSQTRYRKRSIDSKRYKFGSKQSRDIRQKIRQPSQSVKRAVSTHVFDRRKIQNRNNEGDTLQRSINRRVVSVAKLKLQNPGMSIKGSTQFSNGDRITGIRRTGGSSQNIRKKSINITHNTNTASRNSAQKIPIMKYSSSEFKDPTKSKGVTIKDLLTKKLNIYERG